MIAFILATSAVWENPIIVGLLVGIPTTALGVKAYRRAEKLDKDAARAAVIANGRVGIQQVIDGQDRMIDNLQVDNKAVRKYAADLSERLTQCLAAYEDLRAQKAPKGG